jgi:fructokinase
MIVSCGEALIDFVPQRGDSLQYAPCPGGSPYNLAIASARLGAPTGFLGKISRDFFGDMLHDRLVAEGLIRYLPGAPTGFPLWPSSRLKDGEEPRYAFYTENTADRNLVPVDIPESLPDSVKCLEFGSISLLLEPQASTIKSLICRESGKRAISFDPNVRPMMVTDKAAYVAEMEELAGLSTIVKVSSADLEWLYPGRPAMDSASDWLARGAGIVVMTRGKDGAIIIGPSYRVETPNTGWK